MHRALTEKPKDSWLEFGRGGYHRPFHFFEVALLTLILSFLSETSS
jgi:hypothetical protein